MILSAWVHMGAWVSPGWSRLGKCHTRPAPCCRPTRTHLPGGWELWALQTPSNKSNTLRLALTSKPSPLTRRHSSSSSGCGHGTWNSLLQIPNARSLTTVSTWEHTAVEKSTNSAPNTCPNKIVWCCVMLCDVVWCCVMLRDVVWCCVMFCDVVWCCMMLCDVVCVYLIYLYIRQIWPAVPHLDDIC